LEEAERIANEAEQQEDEENKRPKISRKLKFFSKSKTKLNTSTEPVMESIRETFAENEEDDIESKSDRLERHKKQDLRLE
jgi:hypothetical protein